MRRSTVSTQIADVYAQLGVRSGAHAYLACVRNGWISAQELIGVDAAILARTERILTRIDRTLDELVEAIAVRNEREPLTAGQRAYLTEFLAWQHAGAGESDEQRDRTERRLAFVLKHTNVPYP